MIWMGKVLVKTITVRLKINGVPPPGPIEEGHLKFNNISKNDAKRTRQHAGKKYISYSFEPTKFFGSQYF